MRFGSLRILARGRTIVVTTLAAFAISLGGAGCSSPQTDLKVMSVGSHQPYAQHFAHAYASLDSHGDYNVLLACDPAAVGGAGQSLKQIMHIHVLWTPDRPVKIDGPATTNAAIHWYVFLNDRRTDMLEYSGTGFVSIEPDGDEATVTVRNASLHPTFNHGLTDPIGSSRFNGTVVARRNPGRVRELLSEIRTTTAAAAFDHSETAGAMPQQSMTP